MRKGAKFRPFQFVDKLIDKLLRAVEKDADFVFRLSSAYKGTPESLKAKSTKSPDKSGDFCCIARLLIDSAFAVAPTLFAIVAFSFFAVCAFFDSLKGAKFRPFHYILYFYDSKCIKDGGY